MTVRSVTSFSDFILYDTDFMKVKIRYKNRTTGAVETKIISNVKIKINYKTIVSGKLFEIDTRSQFTTKVNNQWTGTNAIDF